MEWTGRQQLFLLLLSGGVGLLLGLLYAVMEGLQRLFRRRRVVSFCMDVGFALTAALVTFFASIGMMDGRLHPLLFAGIAGGFAAAWFGPGRVIARWTVLLYRFIAKIATVSLALAEKGVLAATAWLRRLFGRVFRFLRQKKRATPSSSAKKHKKVRFFQKKA